MAQLRDEGLVFIVPAIFIFIVPDTQESEILKPSKESLNIALIVMHFWKQFTKVLTNTNVLGRASTWISLDLEGLEQWKC